VTRTADGTDGRGHNARGVDVVCADVYH